MKKWIILLVVVALVVVGWYFARQQKFTPPWAQPKFGQVTRGDIRVPITATGLIHPNQAVEVKPEASGIILAVPVVEGTFVHQGEPLVEINPADEQRLRDRAKADSDRAEAMLTQARVAVERAGVSVDSAEASLKELKAQGEITKFEWEKIETWMKDPNAKKADLYSKQQINDARARNNMNLAQQESAQIAIRNAELTKRDAEAAVKSQQATVESFQKTLEDGDARLRKTKVVAPQDAIVTQVFVKPGMLVQSGTQSFMGGTQLMMLADVSKKKVIARLDEADYGRVLNISPVDSLPDMPGLREAAQQDAEQLEKRSGVVKLTVDAFPDKKFEGRIVRVEPQGKLNAGSSIIQFDIHVEITDPQAHMLPLGAQAQVEFTVESAINILRVPAEAVKNVQDQKGVWVKTTPEAGSGDKFGKRFVPCRFGISDGEHTQVIEVLAGGQLKEGDEVYTKLPQNEQESRD